jgi:hypothetical protein
VAACFLALGRFLAWVIGFLGVFVMGHLLGVQPHYFALRRKRPYVKHQGASHRTKSSRNAQKRCASNKNKPNQGPAGKSVLTGV